jgi:hypothetical protein
MSQLDAISPSRATAAMTALDWRCNIQFAQLFMVRSALGLINASSRKRLIDIRIVLP